MTANASWGNQIIQFQKSLSLAKIAGSFTNLNLQKKEFQGKHVDFSNTFMCVLKF